MVCADASVLPVLTSEAMAVALRAPSVEGAHREEVRPSSDLRVRTCVGEAVH